MARDVLSVSGRRLANLSPVTRELHERLSAEAAVGLSSSAGLVGVRAAVVRLSSRPAARAAGRSL